MKHSFQKSKRDNPVFESPEGVRIRINRGGNKMQFIRDLCRDKKITDVQFRMLVPLIDTSNDGTHEDPELWGKSWLKVETLAKESGCSKRAVQENMPKLEAAGIAKVKRDLTDDGRPKGGRSNVNVYWLPGWNRFGAVGKDQEKGADGAPFAEKERLHGAPEKGACGSEKGACGSEKGARDAPDSTHLPNPEPNPSTQPAAPQEGPVDVDGVGGGDEARQERRAQEDHQSGETEQAKLVQDNQPADLPEDWRNQFWDASPERKNVAETEKALIAIVKTGAKFQSILIAARRRCETENYGYYRDPVKWLADDPWLDNAKAAKAAAKRKKPKPQKGMAI